MCNHFATVSNGVALFSGTCSKNNWHEEKGRVWLLSLNILRMTDGEWTPQKLPILATLSRLSWQKKSLQQANVPELIEMWNENEWDGLCVLAAAKVIKRVDVCIHSVRPTTTTTTAASMHSVFQRWISSSCEIKQRAPFRPSPWKLNNHSDNSPSFLAPVVRPRYCYRRFCLSVCLSVCPLSVTLMSHA